MFHVLFLLLAEYCWGGDGKAARSAVVEAPKLAERALAPRKGCRAVSRYRLEGGQRSIVDVQSRHQYFEGLA